MGDIVWEDPPRKGAGREPLLDYESIVKQLRSKPGEWGMILHTDSDKNAKSVYTALRRYQLERTIRQQEDKTFKVYARWMPF